MARGTTWFKAKREKLARFDRTARAGDYKAGSDNPAKPHGEDRRDGSDKRFPERRICETGKRRVDVMVACFDGETIKCKAEKANRDRPGLVGGNEPRLDRTCGGNGRRVPQGIGSFSIPWVPYPQVWEIVRK